MSQLRTGIWFFPDADGARTVRLAQRAERLGIDELWLGDEGPARDPFGLLAACATRTLALRLGVAVTNPYLRHPAITAVSAMTVAELAPGRFRLGVGPGGGIALDPLGIERHRPLARTRDLVRVVRAVAAGQPTDGYRPPADPFTVPTLPIWVGARGEAFNRFASEAADGVFLGGIPEPVLPTVLGWARSVRPIAVAIHLAGVFDPGDVELVRPRLVFSLLDAPPINREALGVGLEETRRAADAYAAGDPEPARRLITDDRLDQIVLRGTPAEVAARLAAIARRTDAEAIGLSLLSPDLERGVDDAAATFRILRTLVDQEVRT